MGNGCGAFVGAGTGARVGGGCGASVGADTGARVGSGCGASVGAGTGARVGNGCGAFVGPDTGAIGICVGSSAWFIGALMGGSERAPLGMADGIELTDGLVEGESV